MMKANARVNPRAVETWESSSELKRWIASGVGGMM